MEFDGTTFVLEIINFLVLVWLLQHFLYKPVTNAIAQRQAGIEKILADAQVKRIEADVLKQQYENRMAEWEQEKARSRQLLLQEIETERARLMTALQSSLEEERNKQRTIEQQRALELRYRLVSEARTEGGKFVALLLSRLASAELEAQIGRLLLHDIMRLPDQDLNALQVAVQAGKARVTSAFPLNESQQADLVEALNRLAGMSVACVFELDTSLMAGLRISIGSCMLRSNLLDELNFFVEGPHDKVSQ